MSSSLFNAVLEAPANTAGIATGDSTWRFAVQMLVASGGARVGKGRVGTARVSDYQWYDITNDLVGVEWTRGAPLGGQGFPRPNVGVLEMTLDNTARKYSSWNTGASVVTSTVNSAIFYAECTPKRLVRVVMFKPTASTSSSTAANGFTTITRTNWSCRFTGFTETWDEEVELGRNLVKLTVSETMGILADINKNGVSPVGAGEKLSERLVRLNADAGWPFPVVEGNTPNYFDTAGFTLQATAMAQNRLGEVYLTGDSMLNTLIFSDTDGSMRVGYGNNITNYDLNNYVGAVFTEPIVRLASSTVAAPTRDATLFPAMVNGYYEPPLLISNNADFVINSVTMACVGGTAQTDLTQSSIDQYGLRSSKRSDLISSSDALALYCGQVQLAESDAYVSDNPTARGWDQTLQPGSVSITDQGDAQRAISLLNLAIVDYYATSGATLPSVRFLSRVVQTHDVITRTAQGIQWSTTVSLMPRFIYAPTG